MIYQTNEYSRIGSISNILFIVIIIVVVAVDLVLVEVMIPYSLAVILGKVSMNLSLRWSSSVECYSIFALLITFAISNVHECATKYLNQLMKTIKLRKFIRRFHLYFGSPKYTNIGNVLIARRCKTQHA